MSVDEAILAKIAEAAARAKLEFILVGNASAALPGLKDTVRMKAALKREANESAG